METRVEFGAPRTECGCGHCVNNCRFMPGYLIPSDLARLCPTGELGMLELDWAREHLRASPGATVARLVDAVIHGERVRIPQPFKVPTLVPAHRPDMSCHWLVEGRCTVHAVAPFGCAFFDCRQPQQEANSLSADGLKEIMKDFAESGPYSQIWLVLESEGLVAPGPEVKRTAMELDRKRGRPDPKKLMKRRK